MKDHVRKPRGRALLKRRVESPGNWEKGSQEDRPHDSERRVPSRLEIGWTTIWGRNDQGGANESEVMDSLTRTEGVRERTGSHGVPLGHFNRLFRAVSRAKKKVYKWYRQL